MNPIVRHISAHATPRPPFVWLLLAIFLTLAGICPSAPRVGTMLSPTVLAGTYHSPAPAPGTGLQSAGFEGIGWAVRDVSIRVGFERTTERRTPPDRGFDADTTLNMLRRLSGDGVDGTGSPDDAASPRPLFHLNSALLI